MPVTRVHKNTEAATLTIESEWDAPAEQVWQLWADPRRLERWWGPPTYPATVVDHDLTPGGRVNYFMTGPEGDRAGGWWRVIAVDAPTRLEFEDGFADAEGEPNVAMPTTMAVVTITPDADSGRTLMRIESQFPSTEAMEKMIEMGMEEGMQLAMGQIDAVLADVAAT
jgi:uncharacterized protein YndB with AHSA1/START domain